MDFTFDEEERAIQETAEGLFAGLSTPERVQEVEAGEDRIDRELWAELAKADLLGLTVPEAYGGGGFGMVALALVLEAQGRTVAPVPLWATVALGSMPIAQFGSEALRAAVLPGVATGDDGAHRRAGRCGRRHLARRPRPAVGVGNLRSGRRDPDRDRLRRPRRPRGRSGACPGGSGRRRGRRRGGPGRRRGHHGAGLHHQSRDPSPRPSGRGEGRPRRRSWPPGIRGAGTRW